MKHIGIEKPCSANWNQMTPTAKGAFCAQCATEVYDFTNQSTEVIKNTLRSMLDQPVCARITAAQEAKLNAEFEAWDFHSHRSFQSALVFSLVVVFGLSLFSCSNEQDHRRLAILQVQAAQAYSKIISTTSHSQSPIAQHQEKMATGSIESIEIPEVIDWIAISSDSSQQEIDVLISTERPNLIHGYAGGMSYRTEYLDFLLATVPVTIELDEYGNPYPTLFETLAYPNPTADGSTIQINVPEAMQAQIVLFDLNGNLLQNIYEGTLNRGTFRQQLELRDLPAGMYLVSILSKDFKETIRISKI